MTLRNNFLEVTARDSTRHLFCFLSSEKQKKNDARLLTTLERAGTESNRTTLHSYLIFCHKTLQVPVEESSRLGEHGVGEASTTSPASWVSSDHDDSKGWDKTTVSCFTVKYQGGTII